MSMHVYAMGAYSQISNVKHLSVFVLAQRTWLKPYRGIISVFKDLSHFCRRIGRNSLSMFLLLIFYCETSTNSKKACDQ